MTTAEGITREEKKDNSEKKNLLNIKKCPVCKLSALIRTPNKIKCQMCGWFEWDKKFDK